MAGQINQQEYEKLIVYLRNLECARKIDPSFYAKFNQILAFHGARLWLFEDPGFRGALEDFYLQFQSHLQSLPEAVDIDQYAPREMVERVCLEARNAVDQHRIGFARELGRTYAERVKLANERTVEALTNSFEVAGLKSASVEEFTDKTLKEISQTPFEKDVQPEVLKQIINERREEIVWFADKEHVVSTVMEDAFSAPVERPDVYTRINVGLLTRGKIDPISRRKEAESLSRLGEALLSESQPAGSFDELLNNFASVAGSQSVKAVAAATGIVFSRERVDSIMSAATGEAFKKSVGDPNFAKELSPSFVASRAFQDLVKSGEKTLVRPAAAADKANFISKLTSSLVINQVTQSLAGDQKKNIQKIFKLVDLGVFNGDLGPSPIKTAPSGGVAGATSRAVGAPGLTPEITMFVWNAKEIFLAAIYAHTPQAFHIDFSPLYGWIFQIGARKAGKSLIGGAATEGIKVGAGAAVQKYLGGAIGTLLGGPGVGTVVGTAISTFIGGVLGKATGLFKSVVGIGGEKSIFDKDLPLFLTVIVLIVIVVPVLPFSFLLFNDKAEKVRTVALETSGEKPVGGGNTLNLSQTNYNIPLPPSSAISVCPVSGGHVVVGYGGSDTHSGAHYYSIDIGVNNSTKVYATHGGTVVIAESNPAAGNTWGSYPLSPGNFVKIEGSTSDGQKYFTTYEHLLGSVVTVGTSVTAGQLIGYSDNTGNSEGPHLHYECDGPASVCSASLPAGCSGT